MRFYETRFEDVDTQIRKETGYTPYIAAAGTDDGQSSNYANLNGSRMAETKLCDDKYEDSVGENEKNVNKSIRTEPK